ncbi:MAG: glycoside hydrolase family 125 protein [Candidatus Eremiobacteraeota bacterium]|nr:glycoside hydrolase family 125 protein [Candidatus Eremiobacteraeota bacterium]
MGIYKQILGSSVALALCASVAESGTIGSVYNRAADVNAACFFRAPDKTTYVSTGDIDAMWLRDSSVQAMSYLNDRSLVRGVIARQERLIALDPYANAFTRDYRVAERKFEIDSLCYPIRLVDSYVSATGDTSVFDDRLYAAMHVILNVFTIEQHHADRSVYHQNERKAAVDTGLLWSAYRPSDDRQVYNYNIPENVFAAVTLRSMASTFTSRYHNAHDANRANTMADAIENAVAKNAIFKTRRGRLYAYEVDGLGHARFMDDANVPSLLSMPLLGYPYDHGTYADTRRFILSPANPYYYRGRYASGIGSAHTPANYIWPMSLVVQYRTASGLDERGAVIKQLAASGAGDGALHESFDANDPRRFTRSKFGWVNALFEQTFGSSSVAQGP